MDAAARGAAGGPNLRELQSSIENMAKRVKILVPGDDPPQIAGSSQLRRLEPYGDVELYDTRPRSDEEKIDRARGFHIIINSRGSVTWRADVLRQLPDLKMITTCSIGTDMIDLAAAAELVQNKLDGVPVTIVRGYDYPRGEGSSRDLIRAREMDLFR